MVAAAAAAAVATNGCDDDEDMFSLGSLACDDADREGVSDMWVENQSRFLFRTLWPTYNIWRVSSRQLAASRIWIRTHSYIANLNWSR